MKLLLNVYFIAFLHYLREHHEGAIANQHLVLPSINNVFWLIHWLLDMKDWACEDWHASEETDTPNWTNVVVWKAYTRNDTTQWFSGKWENLLLFSGTVEITLTHYTQIYFKTFSGIKISWISIYGTESQACQCSLPRIPSCRNVHSLYFAPDNVLSIGCISPDALCIFHWSFGLKLHISWLRKPLTPLSFPRPLMQVQNGKKMLSKTLRKYSTYNSCMKFTWQTNGAITWQILTRAEISVRPQGWNFLAITRQISAWVQRLKLDGKSLKESVLHSQLKGAQAQVHISARAEMNAITWGF